MFFFLTMDSELRGVLARHNVAVPTIELLGSAPIGASTLSLVAKIAKDEDDLTDLATNELQLESRGARAAVLLAWEEAVDIVRTRRKRELETETTGGTPMLGADQIITNISVFAATYFYIPPATKEQAAAQ